MVRVVSWIGVCLFTLVSAPAWADSQGAGHYDGHMMWEGALHGWFLGPILMIVFIVGLVIAVGLVIRWLSAGGGAGRTPGRQAMDILRERFARGEIDEREFEDRRRALEG